jgi:acetyl-CoA acetyltransferase
MASLMAGFPDTTTAISVNRLCSSGLEAVSLVANKIQAGVIDIGLAGGVENMSLYDMMSMIEVEKVSEEVFEHE